MFTGDWWWSSNIVDAYNDRFHPPLLDLAGLPGAVVERVGDVSTWPVAVLAVAALAVGLSKRPYDAAVVFPVALVLALVVVVVRGQISADDVGRMLTALAVFAAAGAAVAVAAHTAGCRTRLAGGRRGRGGPARGGTVACGRRARRGRPGAPGAGAREGRRAGTRGRGAGRVHRSPAPVAGPARALLGPAAELIHPGARDRGGDEYDKCNVAALIVPADGKLPRWIRQVALTHDWRAGVRENPCTK